mmetsp:Transcript_4443/g.18059  ORF Transcript_4443/g.18059 Transcript_4443/m.18059 type:complete len:205 (-) Transcript_4443:341-955(-)
MFSRSSGTSRLRSAPRSPPVRPSARHSTSMPSRSASARHTRRGNGGPCSASEWSPPTPVTSESPMKSTRYRGARDPSFVAASASSSSSERAFFLTVVTARHHRGICCCCCCCCFEEPSSDVAARPTASSENARRWCSVGEGAAAPKEEASGTTTAAAGAAADEVRRRGRCVLSVRWPRARRSRHALVAFSRSSRVLRCFALSFS